MLIIMEEQFRCQLTDCHVRLIYSPRFSGEVLKPKMKTVSLFGSCSLSTHS